MVTTIVFIATHFIHLEKEKVGHPRRKKPGLNQEFEQEHGQEEKQGYEFGTHQYK